MRFFGKKKKGEETDYAEDPRKVPDSVGKFGDGSDIDSEIREKSIRLWDLFEARKYDEVIKNADILIKEDYDVSRAWYYKARALYESELYSDALSCIDKSLVKVVDEDLIQRPEDIAQRVFWKALTLMRLGKYEDAYYYLDDARKRNTEDRWLSGQITYSRAVCCAKTGKEDLALTYLSQLTSMHPETREQLAKDEDFKKFRDNPRFKEMVKTENS